MAIESGLSQPVFSTEAPITRLVQYLLPSFMKTTWEYLHEHNASIQSPSIPKLQTQRQHDQFLMNIFCESSSPAKDLRKLQRCRLFLQALRLSDIATEDGSRVNECIRHGRRPPHYQTTYTFPNQKRPPKKDFNLF